LPGGILLCSTVYSLCMAAKQDPFSGRSSMPVNCGPLIDHPCIYIQAWLFSYVRKSLPTTIIVICLAFTNPKESSWYNLSKKKNILMLYFVSYMFAFVLVKVVGLGYMIQCWHVRREDLFIFTLLVLRIYNCLAWILGCNIAHPFPW
jgi:hypothetical protein